MPRQRWQKEIEELLQSPATGTLSSRLNPESKAGVVESKGAVTSLPMTRSSGEKAFLIVTNVAGYEMRLPQEVSGAGGTQEGWRKSIEAKIAQLEEKVGVLERTYRTEEAEEVVVLRTITTEQAKEEILKLFLSGKHLYMSEVAELLQLPDQQVVEICADLIQKGELMPYDNTLSSR